MKFDILFTILFLLLFTDMISQNKGLVTFKNGDQIEGLIQNKGSQILFYDSEGVEPRKISHEEIEHIKTGDIEYFRESPKSKKLIEYQVMVDGDTKLLARNFQTNYGTMEAVNETTYVQGGNNGLSSNLSSQSSRKMVRGSNSRGSIVKYYIKSPEADSIVQVYRLVVGDVDWLGYKKKVKKLFGECENLIKKMDDGDFKDDEYGKGAELAAIVLYYNQNCGNTGSPK